VKHHVQLAFGLAFDVERAADRRRSGWKPAFGSKQPLFGEQRLDGFANALRGGFIPRLVVVGGDEEAYKNETVEIDGIPQPINRAWAIRQMLFLDKWVDPQTAGWHNSVGNTGGNVAAIRKMMRERKLRPGSCAVLTSHYHCMRAQLAFKKAGLGALSVYPAEAFSLMAPGGISRGELIGQFGDGPLAVTMVSEIGGIANEISRVFKPR
jgi:hypothetical protein